MVGSFTDKTYEAICADWARTDIVLSESQINIWPPLSGGYSIMHRFAKDKEMQNKLFENIQRSLAFVDGHEADEFTYEKFEEQFFHSIEVIPQPGQTVDEYIGTHTNQLFGLFLMGMDNALMKGNTQTFKQVGTLLEKHSHLSLVFLTELAIPELPVYHELVTRHMLVENMHYQPIFSPEDSLAFMKSLEGVWQFTFPQGIEKILAENIGGHALLLEEAARIVRNNPQIGFKDVLSSMSLLRKAGAVYKALLPIDQVTIKALLFGKIPTRVSEYLRETGLVQGNKVGLKYFHYMRFNLLNLLNPFEEEEIPHLKLSYIEHQVLELLTNSKEIVSREAIGKAIWGENADEKYSDWAIDQLIHRLREKLESVKDSREIQTKKGEGFALVEKSS